MFPIIKNPKNLQEFLSYRLVLILLAVSILLGALPGAALAQTDTAGCAKQHVVQRGDNLSRIALQHGVSLRQLIELNNIVNPNVIRVGRTLCTAATEAVSPTDCPPDAGSTANSTAEMAGYRPSAVVLWNEVMLAAIRTGAPRPTVTARALYLVHQAMYDAWTAYDEVAQPTSMDPALRRPACEHTDANKAAAVSQAAYQMLMHLYATYENTGRTFSLLLTMQGYEPATAETDPTSPAGIGYQAAQALIAARANDGANQANNYVDITSAIYPTLYVPANSADPNAPTAPGQPEFDLNRWQPLRVPTGRRVDETGHPMVVSDDPASYVDQLFLTPHWGAVQPFALSSGDQFRPPAPPQAGSTESYVDALGNMMTNDEAYRQQVAELLSISANLTDEQKVIAEYWADGPRSETPPGHWNALAHGISERDRLGIDEDVKLYFALNGALFDASIAAWEAKRIYDYIRPASSIRHLYFGQTVEAWAGPNLGTMPIQGEDWQPYQEATFVTPPFSEYVSGHSTFSAAAAEVLTLFTGSNRFYDGRTILYYEDFNQDGAPDALGQHVVPIGGNRFERSPSEVIILQWTTFQEAADEAGISRRYGGIHFQDGDLYGRLMGKEIGAQAYALAASYWQSEDK